MPCKYAGRAFPDTANRKISRQLQLEEQRSGQIAFTYIGPLTHSIPKHNMTLHAQKPTYCLKNNCHVGTFLVAISEGQYLYIYGWHNVGIIPVGCVEGHFSSPAQR